MRAERPDPRRLRPDHHPTPFTAEEIHHGSTPGRTVRSLIVQPGVEPYVRVMHVVWADDEGGEGDSWTETPDGRRLSEPERWHSTWHELQAHASMPVAITTIDEETIDIPAGRFDCLRYTRVDGDAVDTFWFAKSRAGAPVRFEKRAGGELRFSSTMIDERTEKL
jgi:hypothetical protein